MAGDSLQEQKRRALACVQAGNFPQAKAIYTEMSLAGAGDAETWFMLCAINGHLGLIGEAVRCARQAVTIWTAGG